MNLQSAIMVVGGAAGLWTHLHRDKKYDYIRSLLSSGKPGCAFVWIWNLELWIQSIFFSKGMRFEVRVQPPQSAFSRFTRVQLQPIRDLGGLWGIYCFDSTHRKNFFRRFPLALIPLATKYCKIVGFRS